jgi:hypothetical protein
MENFIDWLKEHPMLAFGIGAIAVFFVIRSVMKQNQTDSSGGAQGDLGSGQVVSAGGYTFVPTGSSTDSTNASGDVNPNTSQDLTALAEFLAAQNAINNSNNAPPATPATPPGSNAPASDTPASSGFDLAGLLQGLQGSDLSGFGTPSSSNGTPKTTKHTTGTPKTTKHTTGTPNQAPGVTPVKPHPHNASSLPPTRPAPVTHPAQGKSHPTAGPIRPHTATPKATPKKNKG